MSNPFLESLVIGGILTAEEAERVNQWTSYRREPIGSIAAEHDILTENQIDEVLNRELHSDRKFGEIAIECGYLTRPTVERLLQLQQYQMLTATIEPLVLSGRLTFTLAVGLLGTFLCQHANDILHTSPAPTVHSNN